MSETVVIDFGSGNLRSVAKALEQVGAHKVSVSADPAVIRAAGRVVFPGQGAIGACAARLAEPGLAAAVREAATNKPFLGICLGLQALFEFSEEDGGVAGLGLVAGRVARFAAGETLAGGERRKVPHMGWNQVDLARGHPLLAGIPSGAWFYFVHSYYVCPTQADLVLGQTSHGSTTFTSALARGNLVATQFHPEKSHHAGLRLLSNFVTWNGED
ncbi:imidazole glycerol phosphate synthase subunit HisH [Immundisolibacter sp.]|uniref:imidazole glycerol phosphate synthase subunit HisH n=1 Tax=Immundisolibacter sp. TaxID=1934948 RepID=UPI003568272F